MALPGGLHLFAHSHPHIPHPRVILEPGVLRVGARCGCQSEWMSITGAVSRQTFHERDSER